jgi:predicted exporter
LTTSHHARGGPILLAVAATALVAGLILAHVTIRSDMADLLPHGRTGAARLMSKELLSSTVTSLIILGIDGAPTDLLADVSQHITRELDRTGLFSFINNGSQNLLASDAQQVLFNRRYLLSPATTTEAFTIPALHDDMEKLLRGLQSSAEPLVQTFGLADPPGAFLTLLHNLTGASRMRTLHGVWFAADRERALILARSRAGGIDVEAQEAVHTAIQQAFAAATPHGARLLAAGPAVFARATAHAMRADVELLSIVSTVLLSALLLWRFRSVWMLLVVAVPVALGIAAAALVVQIVFGFVHGITIGFGMTMLGVTLDYPVLLVGHRKQDEAASDTLRRIDQAFRLTALSTTLGLTGMLFSGFPGLSQLGCFSVVGVAIAAVVTRWCLPPLIIKAGLAPISTGDPARLLRIEHARVWRGWVAGTCLLAGIWLAAVGGPRWQTDLAALSPVPASALALDAELRHEIGAPDAVLVGLVQGDTAETVLRREEQLLPALDALVYDGVLGGVEVAARLLPSAETQLARRAILPTPDELAARIATAQVGLPFRVGAFRPFVEAVAASRVMTPLLPSDIASPLIKERLDPLLFERDGVWYGPIAPTDLRDPARFATVIHRAGAIYVNIAGETNAIVADYTSKAWHWLAAGGLAALVTVAVGLRSYQRVLGIATAILAALLLTVVVLTAAGALLSLVHIVSLQFVAGVGLDYALFFARRQLDQEERARTLRTLIICNAMTVLTFGMLALCRTPLLQQIGITVVIGSLAALVLAFLFAGAQLRSSTGPM